jgi:cobalt-zinc-cadmium efflux system outer membrane protein
MPENRPTLVQGLRRTGGRRWGILFIPGLMLATGCLYGGREATDETVKEMASRPFDQLPEQLREKSIPPADQTSARKPTPPRDPAIPMEAMDVQTASYMQAPQPGKQPGFLLQVPEAIPGAEAPRIAVPEGAAARAAELNKLYPPLPPLDPEIQPLPGPDGKPYTLSDLQRIAAENSPTLRQAASDVQAARGNVMQTKTYQNPTVSLQEQASNNNSTGGAFGFSVDQMVSTGGKMRLQTAAAEKSLENAELALRRARSDLATQVRNAYYALLVAKESIRVTRAVAVLTDEVYRLQLTYAQNAGQSAAYEPAALRAQAWTARLAYKQATATYALAWKTLVATIGLGQLPFTEVAGRIDSFVPYYDFDRVLAHVLQNHTDMLTARNGIDVQRFNLKVAQITPYAPNIDFNIGMFKDRALLPYGTYATFGVSAPLPFWDQNRGNILQAEAALARALEEPHRVELALTNTLAANFQNYQTNLEAIEYYRRYILPDQVRAYRGTLERRQVDINAQFGDLVAAQQALAGSVTTYLTMLGSLWTSVISVADMLQTNDLFQAAAPHKLEELPSDLDLLPPLPCCHPFGQNAGHGNACMTVSGVPTTGSPASAGVGPAAKPPATAVPSPMPNISAPRTLPPSPAAPTAPQSQRSSFRLTDDSVVALRSERVPETVLVKLYPLRNKDLTPGEFMSEMNGLLSAEEAGRYEQTIMNHALRRGSVAGTPSPEFRSQPRVVEEGGVVTQTALSTSQPAAPAQHAGPPPGIVPSVLPGGW